MEKAVWIFGALLAGILLLAIVGLLRQKEGFQTRGPAASVYQQEFKKLLRCPVGYKAFHSPAGDSLCCKGDVNPYTHQCGSRLAEGICSLAANVADPRNPQIRLPLCSDLQVETAATNSTFCPPSLPYYAEESTEAAKCCQNPIVIKGQGYGCSTTDMADKQKYCIMKGTLRSGEQRCDALASAENATCPTDATGRPVLQKVEYKLGEREANYYKVPDLNGVPISLCTRINETCIPKESLEYAQVRGAFTEYNPDTWEFSCENWKRRVDGSLVPDTVRGYLKSTGVAAAAGPPVAAMVAA